MDIVWGIVGTIFYGAVLANVSIWTITFMQYKGWLTIKLWPALVISYVFWQLFAFSVAFYATNNGWTATFVPAWKLVAQIFFYALFFYVTWPKPKTIS